MITREQALDELHALQKSTDTEAAHLYADHVLQQIIREVLGWHDVADAWDAIYKWYA